MSGLVEVLIRDGMKVEGAWLFDSSVVWQICKDFG